MRLIVIINLMLLHVPFERAGQRCWCFSAHGLSKPRLFAPASFDVFFDSIPQLFVANKFLIIIGIFTQVCLCQVLISDYALFTKLVILVLPFAHLVNPPTNTLHTQQAEHHTPHALSQLIIRNTVLKDQSFKVTQVNLLLSQTVQQHLLLLVLR